MKERTRNRRMHRYWDTCPWCYRHGSRKGRKQGGYLFRCICGGVWRWKKNKLKLVLCTSPND